MAYLIEKIPELLETYKGLPIIKPHGRGKGSSTWKKLHWHVIYTNKETGQILEGKYPSVKEINKNLNLNITSDNAYRISEGIYSNSNSEKIKQKWQHLKIIKINETIANPNMKSYHRNLSDDEKYKALIKYNKKHSINLLENDLKK